MRRILLLAALIMGVSSASYGQIISQYIETSSGTTPKGIEIWNNTLSTLDFSVNNLVIEKGTNGGSPGTDYTLSSGTLASGEVIVIGTSDMSTTVTGNGATFYEKSFTFNGDDALVVKYGGTTTDVFGNPGSDPGSAWTGGSVSSANQNIQIITDIKVGDTDGWTDPSERFEYVAVGTDMTGFGIAPSTSLSSSDPVLSVSPSTLADLGYSIGSGPSAAKVFELSGSNLDGSDISATAPTDFEVSTDSSGSYASTVTFSSYDGTSDSVWVRLASGKSGGDYSGDVTVSGGGADSKTVAVSGTVEAPKSTSLPYSQDFSSDFGDIYVYSVSGSSAEWVISGSAAYMSGYNSGEDQEDWMILPSVDLDAATNPIMTFDTEYQYGTLDADNYLKLFYSSDYAGYGDPTSATWTEISFTYPSSATTLTGSGNVDLSAISGSTVYLAFKYLDDDNSNSFRNWEVDNISIEDAVSPELSVSSSSLSGFSYTESNAGPSSAQSFDLSGLNLTGTDVTVTAPSNFEVSETEGSGYSGSVTLSSYDGTSTTIYTRLSSGLSIDSYSGDITVSGGGASSVTVSLSGSVTYDLVINEILADPDATNGDANNDGSVNTTEDEFVEIVNTGSSDLDISNWSIEDATGNRHTFAASTTLKPNQAVLVFGGGSPSGTFGGALVFTASSGTLGLNNAGDDIILKDDLDNTILSVTYGGEAGDNQSITLSPDLTGSFTKHSTADTDDASLFSPGTKINGTPFLPYSMLTGSEGWRLIASPIDTSISGFFAPIWTQGFTGSNSPVNGSSNVYVYQESAAGSHVSGDAGYISLADTSISSISTGNAFAVYVFEDDDYATEGTQGGFPKTLTFAGTLTTTDHVASFSFTDNSLPSSDGWNLTGNPFGKSVNVDELNFSSYANLYNYVHVYRNGAFVQLDASGASTTDTVGIGEAFFVQVDAAVSYTFPYSAANAKKVSFDDRMINFTLSKDDMRSFSKIRFHEMADFGVEQFDAGYMKSLESSYIGIYSEENDERKLSVNALPFALEEEVSVSLSLAGTETGDFDLDWDLDAADFDGWSVTLVDTYDGTEVNMLTTSGYSFEMANEVSANRFKVVTNPGTINSNEEVATPQAFSLEQNYPNPFNPSTTIEYSVDKAGAVNLSVYNLMGQKVAELVNEAKSAGSYKVQWNAAGSASGMYYYRLDANGVSITRKMTLIK